jgi:predicted MFS family arabinose efflux permease
LQRPDVDDRIARKNVFRLAAAQALAGANSTVIMTTGAIVGSILAPSAKFATLPVSVYVVGTALSTLPVGALSRARGRQAAFAAGTSLGVVVGLLAALALYLGSFWLFCCATFLAGFYQAAAQTFRFAATDTSSAAFRPKALSWVMIGGVFSGILGPQLVNLTMNLWQPYLFMASFTAQAAVAVICMAVLAGVKLPPPAAAGSDGGRPLAEIARQPRFMIAVLSAVVTYALMNLLMTSAPLAMKLCGLSLQDANWGIQWHIVAMFLPSFWTGSLIGRFGAPRVVTVGLLLIASAAVVGLSGISTWHFWTGLVLLGLGWNFGFVGASTMVVETHRPEERNRVQAFNDFLVFGSMAVASFSSGQILASNGWEAVNWVVFPPIVFAILALAITGAYRPREALAG